MSSPTHQEPARNGARSSNLFFDADTETGAPAPAVNVVGRRGRGLVVTLEDDRAPRGRSDAERFTRTARGLGGLPAAAQQPATRADRNAQRLLTRISRQRFGALVTFIGVAALLFLVSWLGLSLRSANADRDRAESQQVRAASALAASRTTSRALIAQRDGTRRAAAITRARQTQATTSATRWHARADRLEREAARARKAKSKR